MSLMQSSNEWVSVLFLIKGRVWQTESFLNVARISSVKQGCLLAISHSRDSLNITTAPSLLSQYEFGWTYMTAENRNDLGPFDRGVYYVHDYDPTSSLGYRDELKDDIMLVLREKGINDDLTSIAITSASTSTSTSTATSSSTTSAITAPTTTATSSLNTASSTTAPITAPIIAQITDTHKQFLDLVSKYCAIHDNGHGVSSQRHRPY
eukprot:295492_1